VDVFGSALTPYGNASTTVTFNGTSTTVTSSPTQFCAPVYVQPTVPTGATSGNVVVNSNGTLSNPVPFTVP
jgi:hypothetical protein